MLSRFKHILWSRTGLLIYIALLALWGMAMNSVIIESMEFRTVGDNAPPVKIDAPYVRINKYTQEITMHFYYRGYGNSTLRLTPRPCFVQGYNFNDKHFDFPDRSGSFCEPLNIDLKDQVRRGDNTITILTTNYPGTLDIYSPNIGFAAGSPLFGTNNLQSFCTAILVLCVYIVINRRLKNEGFSWLTRLMFLGACSIFLDCLYIIPQYAYSLDLEKHIPYIQYMGDHFFYAHGYKGPESWHPPLYYMICAIIARAFQFTGVFDPWTGIRLFGIACYTTFLYFGMHSLTRLFKGLPFYLALALLLYWPSGLLNAAWVFNDVLMYPIYGACFYYTLVWFETMEPRLLNRILLLCGIGFCVKTTVLVPAGIVGLCVLLKLFQKKLRLLALFSRDYTLGRIALMIGVIVNFSGVIYDQLIDGIAPPPHLGGAGNYFPTLDSFLFVDVRGLVAQPFFNSWENPSPWAIMFQTMLFTNSYWRFAILAGSLLALLFLMIAYIGAFMLTLSRKRYGELFPIITGLQLPFIASVVFTLVCSIGACMDFRYIQPALIAMTLSFMLAVQEAKAKDHLLLYYLGNSIAILLPALSVIMYYAQMHT